MAVQALVLVKTVPGKTRNVVSQLAAAKKTKGGRQVYSEEGVKHVYRASGYFDVIVHVSSRNTQGIFDLVDRISGYTASTQSAIAETQIIFVVPKAMGDP